MARKKRIEAVIYLGLLNVTEKWEGKKERREVKRDKKKNQKWLIFYFWPACIFYTFRTRRAIYS